MCVVSNIGDYGRKYHDWTLPAIPVQLDPVRLAALEARVKAIEEKFNLLDDIMKRVKALEDQAGVPPCEDPSKTAFMEEVRKSLVEALEALDKVKVTRRKKPVKRATLLADVDLSDV